MNYICCYKVPKAISLGAHGIPKKHSADPGCRQAVQVIWIKALCVLWYVQVHQLGNHCEGLKENRERNKHLQGEEKLSFFAGME